MLKVLWVIQAHRATQVHKAPQELKELWVIQVLKVLWVIQVLRAPWAQSDPKALLEQVLKVL